MTRTTRPWTKVAAAAALSLAASLLIAPSLAQVAHADDPVDPAVAHPPIWDKGPGGERYVAFGDSFTSGPGIAPMRAECGRSEKNFPTLVAQTFDVTAFTDASCAAATTENLTTPQSSMGLSNNPQLDALSPDTTLVTFGTLGGNDIGLVQLAAGCPFSDCVASADLVDLEKRFADTRARLVAGIEETQRRSPDADIVVVGYGTYLPPQACPTVIGGVTPAESVFVQGQIDRLSDTLKSVADEAGVAFADLRTIPGAGERTACATPRKQWIRAFETYEDGIVLHPSACGMDAMGQQVANAIRKARGQSAVAFDASCVSAGPADPEEPPVVTPPQPPVVGDDFRAIRMKNLRAKARTVKLSASCHGPRKASKRTLKLKVTGGRGAIAKVEFRAAKKKLAVDRKAPWTTKKKAKTVRKHLKKKSSRLVAVVTLKDGPFTVTTKVKKKRPSCVR